MNDFKKICPNWNGMLRNLRREATPERVYFLEFGMADPILDQFDDYFNISQTDRCEFNMEKRLWRTMRIHHFLGHELFRVFPPGRVFPIPALPDGTPVSKQSRIHSWKDFDAFPWPAAPALDLSILEFYEKNCLPEMKVFIVTHLWESVRDLFGYENFCMKLYDDPQLVEAVFSKVSAYIQKVFETYCQFTCLGAVFLADDMGFKTAPALNPEDIRKYILPRQKTLADIAHGHGKLFFLHSCGQVYDLVDDFIDELQIDAKHSFEDTILSVEGAKNRFGEKLSLIGGLDVDFLARSTPETIRKKVRQVIEICNPGGGFLFASGNWVTHYIPFENYLAALDEARKFPQLGN